MLCRPGAAAPIRRLVWELLQATCAALKRKKRKKETALQHHFFLCPILLHSLPYPSIGVGSQEHSLKNALHTNLSLRVCFLGHSICNTLAPENLRLRKTLGQVGFTYFLPLLVQPGLLKQNCIALSAKGQIVNILVSSGHAVCGN